MRSAAGWCLQDCGNKPFVCLDGVDSEGKCCVFMEFYGSEEIHKPSLFV